MALRVASFRRYSSPHRAHTGQGIRLRDLGEWTPMVRRPVELKNALTSSTRRQRGSLTQRAWWPVSAHRIASMSLAEAALSGLSFI